MIRTQAIEKMKIQPIIILTILSLPGPSLRAQSLHEYPDSVVLENDQARVILHLATGKVDYRFLPGITLTNTVGYLREPGGDVLFTSDLATSIQH